MDKRFKPLGDMYVPGSPEEIQRQERKITKEDLFRSLLEEVVSSDMAMREEDEGRKSDLLKRIRKSLK